MADLLAGGDTIALPTGDGHVLHVATFGPRSGRPMVFLHGGPGSGCQPSHRDLFDATRDFVIFIDQRGAGRSTPHGGRANNTTAHLIADLERVRALFDLEAWTLVGGSWGATLALAYSAAHPERVRRLVLRATFLGTRAELELAFNSGLRTRLPDLHGDFLSVLPAAERANPLDSYWARILSADPAQHRPAAMAWHDVERILSVAHPPTTRLVAARLSDATLPLPATPFMEAHYFRHDCFLPEGALAGGLMSFRHVPARIIHGAEDHLCSLPVVEAFARAWTAARLEVVEGAGHALSEAPIFAAVKRAIAED